MSTKRNPAETVAVLLIGLGEDLASELLQRLQQHDAERILRAASKLKNIDEATINDVLGKFAESLGEQRAAPINAANFAKTLINKAFPVEIGASLLDSLPKEVPRELS